MLFPDGPLGQPMRSPNCAGRAPPNAASPRPAILPRCDDLLAAPVAGFVLVSRVDLERKRITLLSPSPLALPSTTLLAGSLKWIST